ncbi:hypothetical protein [Phaeobacter sp. HF9A]|uniref:hypothetical protein n=1 Tax=Phaeobacter sp. HF9A TaxID=2721561 RepID=UPI0014313D2C|nr:hypothetical protein [Phaeobacter sp. HF9A]NIZ13324.1 hypothetical protein [Phaeobacter sp. HF9A]
MSVDIVGSTRFKKPDGSWKKLFVHFFKEFPKTFHSKLELGTCCDFCSKEKKTFPKVWRTRGDELIFVITPISINNAIFILSGFTEAISEYMRKYDDFELKGNAWTAAFPVPNVSIFTQDVDSFPHEGVIKSPENLDRDSNEDLEIAADEMPAYFDFLGVDMDIGFRVSRNSRPDFTTISLGLACLLCEASADDQNVQGGLLSRLSVERREVFKGVADERAYPVLGFLGQSSSTSTTKTSLDSLLLTPRGNATEFQTILKGELAELEHDCPVLKLNCDDRDVEDPPAYKYFLAEEHAYGEKLSQAKMESSVDSGANGAEVRTEAELSDILKRVANFTKLPPKDKK